MDSPANNSNRDQWTALSRFTGARIALGRAGGSWRTKTMLDFKLAHAQARDAVGKPFAVDGLEAGLRRAGFETVRLTTQADNHPVFLKHPDLGRLLSENSRQLLLQNSATWGGRNLAVVVS